VLANIIKSSDKQQEDTIHSVIEELKSGEYYVTGTNPQKWIFELIATSKDYPYPEIHQAMLANPMRVRLVFHLTFLIWSFTRGKLYTILLLRL
jgi:hypothetical protein